jgi:hypothetical protein
MTILLFGEDPWWPTGVSVGHQANQPQNAKSFQTVRAGRKTYIDHS